MSAAKSVTATFNPIPSTPSLSISQTTNGFQLTWNGVSNATQYNIYWGTSNAVTESSNAFPSTSSTAYAHTGLSNNSTYYYRIKACNGSACSALSSTVYKTYVIPCTYILSSNSNSVAYSAGSGSVSITASNSVCSWTAASNASWVSKTSGGGNGSGSVAYSVAANTSTSTRQGTMTIAGQTFTVNQAAAPTPPTVNPNSVSVVAGKTINSTVSGGTSPYAVTSSNTKVATASISGSTVTITGVAQGSATVTVTDKNNLSASIAVTVTQSFALSVTKSGTGTGTITASPGTLNWSGNTGTATYNANDNVTLTATQGSGSTLGGVWTGCDSNSGTNNNQCIVKMSSAKSVSTTFKVQQYTLTVNTAGTGNGTVSPGSSCYNANDNVTITASASKGSTFAGWSGACSGTLTTCSVTMSTAKSVTATFTSQASRPILFVHGIWGKATDFAAEFNSDKNPLLTYLSTSGQLPSDLYPDNTLYYAIYISKQDSVVFYKSTDNKTLQQVSKLSVPSSARFFSIQFRDPDDTMITDTIDIQNVAKISILNKAYELSQVIKQITAITQIKDVIVVAHSMGGLVARAYIENMASVGSCSISYNGTCKPGDGNAAYAGDVGDLITVDTPHNGSLLPYLCYTLNIISLPNSTISVCNELNVGELTKSVGGTGLIEALNYGGTIAGKSPQKIQTPIQAVEDYLSTNYLLMGDSDVVVSKDSQSIKNSVSAGNTSATFTDVPVEYKDNNVLNNTNCKFSGVPALHPIRCLGAQTNTQAAIANIVADHATPSK
ncbi:MAG: hypothetical protein HQK96_08465 [Nitrospirae bacterium]|nr:hypothetical protein [Nitrospirota bacterium]